MVDDDADAGAPCGQPERGGLIEIVAAQIDDDTVAEVAVRTRADESAVSVVTAEVDDERGAFVEVIRIGAMAADHEQPVGGLLNQEQITRYAGNRLRDRLSMVEGDVQLLQKFPVAQPGQPLRGGNERRIIHLLHEQRRIAAGRFGLRHPRRRRDLRNEVFR